MRFYNRQPPQFALEFRRWLEQGRHGEMAYLAKNAHKRIDPEQVLAGARSTIVLATSYAGPAVEESLAAERRGVIARYARYRDYHDVLSEKLKALTTFVNEL